MTDKQFYYGYLHDPVMRNRVQYLQSSPDGLRFTLGQELENYDYTKPLLFSFEELIENRLKQLRKKYSYIRFWFSGGKDSRLVLDACIRYNIHFDEIVILRHCPVGRNVPLGGQVETDANAIKYIKDIGYAQCPITVINLDNDHYDAVFKNHGWHIHGNTHTFHAPLYQSYFFQYVNAEFGYFDVGEGIVDLLGCIQPHVYWHEDAWRFSFVDFQFFNQLRGNLENFMVTNEYPEILHGYVRDLVEQFRIQNISVKKFQTHHLRNMRDLVNEFKKINLPRPDLETPKTFHDPWRPSNHYFWEVNDVYKTLLSCFMLYNQDPWSPAFDHYVNQSNWKEIKMSRDAGGITSKEFVFSL